MFLNVHIHNQREASRGPVTRTWICPTFNFPVLGPGHGLQDLLLSWWKNFFSLMHRLWAELIFQSFRYFITSQLILQPFRHFIYITAHSPSLLLLHLRHSSFSNPSFAFPIPNSVELRSWCQQIHVLSLISDWLNLNRNCIMYPSAIGAKCLWHMHLPSTVTTHSGSKSNSRRTKLFFFIIKKL